MSQTSRVHIYCRVSSTGQEDNTSLDTQEAASRAWCAERALSVASVAREVWSGADRHRPELDALIARVLPGDLLLAYDLDRLSRGGQVDTAVIIDRVESAGASVAFVTLDFEKSETGALLRNVRAFAAALEREKITERTQRGRRAWVAAGKPIVGPKAPYGYLWADVEKSRLVVDPETAGVVRFIFDLALDGVALRRMSTVLAEKGIRSPSGAARWQPSSIREILLRSTYAGSMVTYATKHVRGPNGVSIRRPATAEERVILAGIAEPIVSPEELAAVAARLEQNKAHSTRGNRHPEAALLRAGYIVCGHCGWTMSVQNATPASRRLSPQYRCNARHQHSPACPGPSISASVVDGAVWQRVSGVLSHPEIIATEVAKHREVGGLDRDLAAVEKRLAAIITKQTKIARAIASVDDDAAEPLYAELTTLAASKTATEAERDNLQRRVADQEADRETVRTLTVWCETVSQNLHTLTYDERRLALDALGIRVRAYRLGTTDANGKPYPRWDMTLNPISAESGILYSSTRRTGRRA